MRHAAAQDCCRLEEVLRVGVPVPRGEAAKPAVRPTQYLRVPTSSSCCKNTKHRAEVTGHNDVCGEGFVTPVQLCYRQWKLLLPRVVESTAAAFAE